MTTRLPSSSARTSSVAHPSAVCRYTSSGAMLVCQVLRHIRPFHTEPQHRIDCPCAERAEERAAFEHEVITPGDFARLPTAKPVDVVTRNHGCTRFTACATVAALVAPRETTA